jgi:hypothetical protein
MPGVTNDAPGGGYEAWARYNGYRFEQSNHAALPTHGFLGESL